MTTNNSNISNRNLYTDSDDISFKELLNKAREYLSEIKNNWKLIIYISLTIISLFIINAWITPTTYPAKLTFMLNDEKGIGSSGGLENVIIGQFLGGGQGEGYNFNKMLSLAKSRRINQLILFSKIDFNGKYDFLANHLIEQYDFQGSKWSSNDALSSFFFTNASTENFSPIENAALKALHSFLISEIVIITPSETGILEISAETTSEKLSIEIAKTTIEKLGQFYIDKAIEKQKTTYQIVKARTDSLEMILNELQFSLLKFDDNNRSLLLNQYNIKRQTLQRETGKLSVAYAEAYKNMEIAKFALENQTPFIQIIDLPIIPIKRNRILISDALLLGGALGCFLAIIFIIIRKIYYDNI